MEWQSKKMSVQLAAQTLSNSVAESIEFLSTKLEGFKNAKPTIKYIKIVNNSFDVMNSTKLVGADGFKRLLSMDNHVDAFNLFKEAMPYLKAIQVEGELKPIFSSLSRTPFIGFYFNMMNFEKIFDDYVRTGKIECLITHRFSQDLIESLFSCIRSMGGESFSIWFTYVFISFQSFFQGYNDNPTAQQFESSIRKLMVHNDVVCSPNSNCPIGSRTEILNVSSNRPSTKENVCGPSEMPEDDWLDLEFFEISQYTDNVADHSIAYMASVIEARIMAGNRYNNIVKCTQCVTAFIQNTLIEDEFIRFKSRSSNV